ncbi:hypothetical protein CVV38_00955 [Candidatus Peregrinibacteria bacterium HGW-Peregrinibacteria-1]|jgi:tetratricopeptide (TPR) repeat protein|nr:MAG: hypothetical protein CVV38_00955 [Candidatus Peregrinibacteria bacterium HGW-Peregrinibacteria-1]
MWTFLAMLLGITLFVGVFARRLFLTVVGLNKTEPEAVEADDDFEEDDKIRLKKGQRQEVNTLFEEAEKKINRGEEEEAIKIFVKILSIDPLHEASKERLALLYLQREAFSSAATLFESLAKLNDSPIHYSHWGIALYQQGDYENAKSAYIEALKLDNSRAQRYASLSQIYRALGQNYNAMVALNKAIEVQQENGGDIIPFWFLVADLQLEMGLVEASKSTLEGILIIDADNEEAKHMLSEISSKEV